jgi:hypothetical protein
VIEGPNERSGKYNMGLRSDKQQHIQTELDLPSALAGEARGTQGRETESPSVAHGIERPANPNRLMEEVCARENLKEAFPSVNAQKRP